MRFQLVITPTPPRGGGGKVGFPDGDYISKKRRSYAKAKENLPPFPSYFPYYFSQSGGRDRFLLADFFLIC